MSKKALITGIAGQDGSYLAEFLLGNGYEVYGIRRRASSYGQSRIKHIEKDLKIYTSDLTDSLSLTKIISSIQPDEIYNLAAQSHVQSAFDMPDYTATVDALGPHRILEIIRLTSPDSKFYQASSVEIFSGSSAVQTENDIVLPRNPYGISKAYAYFTVESYRSIYNIYACNGILFNHESPRRGEDFVTKKIVSTLKRMSSNRKSEETLELGNIDVLKDWGHAKDFVRAKWEIMQLPSPEDFIVATGEQHTVREFVEIAGRYFGYNIQWEGAGLQEIGRDWRTGSPVVSISQKFFRPIESPPTYGDFSKLKNATGWEPKFSFEEMVHDMCFYEQTGRESEKKWIQ